MPSKYKLNTKTLDKGEEFKKFVEVLSVNKHTVHQNQLEFRLSILKLVYYWNKVSNLQAPISSKDLDAQFSNFSWE